MGAYLRRLAQLDRDVRLFMVYALLSYLGIGVSTLIFNLYLVELGYDEAFIGAFNAAFTVAMGLTCVTLGFLINRFGTWACIAWGTLEFVLTSFALCFITEPVPILILAILNGVGSAIILTTQMPFVIEWTPPDLAATVAALSSSLNSASVMVGSLVGGVLPAILAGWLDVSSSGVTAYRWTLVAGAWLTTFGMIPVMLMGTVRHARHHADFQVGRAQLLNHDVRRQARRDVLALILLGLLLALGVGAIEPFYNVLLDDMGTPASTIGIIFAVSGLATALLSLAGPPIFRRFGPVAAQLSIRLLPIPFHLALIGIPSAGLLSVAYATRRISGSMAWPIESAHVGSLLPAQARAHAFGLRSASWNFGFALSAVLSGWVIASTGSYVPAYLAMGVFCTASVLVYVVAYGRRGIDQPATTTGARSESTEMPTYVAAGSSVE